VMAIWRFLSDHFINNQIIEAGSTQNDLPGGLLPSGWLPTLGVEPVDSAAITAFWNKGPSDFVNWYLAMIPFSRWQNAPIAKPLIFWIEFGTPIISSEQQYILTGSGQALGPRMR
jgi:hypothetical protein